MGPEGWGNRNREGKLLLEFCKRNGLAIANSWYKKRSSNKITWYSGDWSQTSVVDYVLVDRQMMSSLTDVKVIPSEALDSDHRLLVATLREKKDRRATDIQEKRLKTWMLKEDERRTQYQTLIRKKLPKEDQRTVEEEWGDFKRALVEAAETVCGRTSTKRRSKETPWWNNICKEAVLRKNNAFREWFQTRTEEARVKYKGSKKAAQTIHLCPKKRGCKWLEDARLCNQEVHS
ncbi:uncharacterized protein LOC126475126 [Schistocerca serialis cubense]|uniref:uncharacterized protein LOC126475126 n=1 Tax=Schistocerca serialis cubense TaxID=2023355 RepID=UPI00214EBE2C|nr:uncharacterized protein LOC126475126 [Schistocerca serialis cubense]